MTTITKAQAYEICDEAGINRDSLRGAYNGKGMYGEHCIGWVVDSLEELAGVVTALHTVLGKPAARRVMASVSQDDYGKGSILYFPGVTLVK